MYPERIPQTIQFNSLAAEYSEQYNPTFPIDYKYRKR